MCISKVFQNYFTFFENNEKNIETKKTIEIKEKKIKNFTYGHEMLKRL